MLRKIYLLLLIVAVLVGCCGCAKETRREVEIVQVTIVDAHYKAAWMQPMMIGKTMTAINHPAEYRIIVEYDGIRKTISNSMFYQEQKNNVGGTTKMNLVTIYYDNGEIRRNLERIG